MQNLGEHAFFSCEQLKIVNLSNSLTSLPNGCFRNTAISSIILPENITTLGDNCFMECSQLKSIQLPAKIQKIGGGVFPNIDDLQLTFDNESDLSLSDEFLLMNKAQTKASQYLRDETSITIPYTVKILQTYCFYGKTNLNTITIPSNSELTTIKENCFADCSKLQTIDLPQTLETIGSQAFYNCTKIQSFSFSSNLTLIGKEAFRYCDQLSSVIFTETDDLIIESYAFANCQNLLTVTLAEGIYFIGDGCFLKCNQLHSINIPQSLTYLGSEAFSETALTKVDIVDSCLLTNISYRLFYKATLLSSITLSNSISKIDSEAFAYTALTKISIPESVTSIGNKCFSGCTELTSFEAPSWSSKLEFFESYVFEDCSKLSNIYVNNSYFMSQEGILYTANIDKLVFFPPASKIHFFSIPNTLQEISITAFYKCRNLYEVLIPDNTITKISQSAFEECNNLVYINFPKCVKEVGENAFKGCKKLSCGLFFEDLNSIQNQLIAAQLPKRCFQSCIQTACGTQSEYFICRIVLISLLLTHK